MKILKAAFVLLTAILVICAVTAESATDGWKTVRGQLEDAQGRRMASVSLLLVEEQGEPVVIVRTDQEGLFEAELPPGDWEVFSESGQKLTTFSLSPETPPVTDLRVRQLPTESADQAPEFVDGPPISTVRPTSSLDAIGDYRILERDYGAHHRRQPTARLVNPFQARKARIFNGSVYLYHRNDNLDARNFFDPPDEPLPEFKRNQFGALVGADITPNLNVLFSYDGLRIIKGSTILSQVPTGAIRRGDFSALETPLVDPLTGEPYPGNVIPREQLHPVSMGLLGLYPAPNLDDPVRNYVNSTPEVQDADRYSFRGDWQFHPNTRLFARYTRDDEGGFEVEPLPTFGFFVVDDRHDGVASVTHNFSPKLNSTFRVRLERSRDLELSVNSGREGLLASVGIPGLTILGPVDEGYPEFEISGFAALGDGDSPRTVVRNQFEIESDWGFVWGDHNLDWGMEVGHVQLNRNLNGGNRRGSFSFSGRYTGDAFADFLLGFPDEASRGIGSNRNDIRRYRFEAFLRDDWRISPKWSLNLAVRYFYFGPPRATNPISGFYPLLFEPPMDGEIVIAGSDRANEIGFDRAPRGSLVLPDRNNWAPTIGFAFSPFGNNRLLVRASYGIFYDRLDEDQAGRFMGRNTPFFDLERAESSIDQPELTLDNPFQTAASSETTIRGIDPNIRTPYIQNWNLRVQKNWGQSWSFEIGYRGEKGTKMYWTVPANVPEAAEGAIQERRPNADYGRFSIYASGGTQKSHNLNVQFQKRLSSGLAVTSGFDWNKTLRHLVFDNASNPRDLDQEFGRIPWRPPSSFFVNYLFDLPTPLGLSDGWLGRFWSGWRLSGITRINAGQPFTVGVSGDPSNDGLSGDRPNRIGDGNLPSSERTVDRWFDTDAFTFPDPFTFGDSGRSILRGPGFQTWDIALSKRTPVADGHTVEFRVQFFNAFNKANFEQPDATLGNSGFGRIFGARRAREIEIALKYTF